MRYWPVLFILFLASGLLLRSGGSELFTQAVVQRAAPFLPGSIPYTARHEVRDRGLAAALPNYREAALDAGLPFDARIGAAELWRLAALVAGDTRGPAYDEIVEATAALARDFPDEPVAGALALETLRVHRLALGCDPEDASLAAEESLAYEAIAAGLELDPENGYCHFVAAEIRAQEGRLEEARDALLQAARCASCDPRLERRFELAQSFLLDHRVPLLQAREFLLALAYATEAFRPGTGLQEIARRLGRADAATLGQAADPDGWVTTLLAIDSVGGGLAETTLLLEDARDACGAIDVYVNALGTSSAARSAGVPRDEPGRAELLQRRVAAAGYAKGEHQLARHRAAREAMSEPLRGASSPERVREGTELIGVAVEAQSILVAWAAIAAAVAALAGIGCIWMRRRPGPPLAAWGFHCVALLALPAALMVAFTQGLFPLERGHGVERLLIGCAEPHALLLALPLLGAAIFGAGCLLLPAHRSLASYVRTAGFFYLRLTAFLLLTFALTGVTLERVRADRLQAFDRLLAASRTAAAGLADRD